MGEFLRFLVLIAYFAIGISAFAWLFDKGTGPQRSVLWVGPWITGLFLFIIGGGIVATWVVRG